MTIRYAHVPSPVGPLLLAASDEGLHLIEFQNPRHPMAHCAQWKARECDVIRLAARQLGEYFDGARQAFDLPLAARGTPFQLSVWHTLDSIPYGGTISYAQLAQRVGRPSAMRAVGAANGRNPLPIVLPCHRVIGSDGSLTGFGGGLPTKEYLLRMEGALPVAVDLFG
ncbi:methylated-DNA--[protein]-cysteine S-methyltransferase [Lysobacter sp. FW306-1B-D06B]|uniref:methylated-DNA--[protein]-cysteine S-methyltransferase n=1 Tax=Lysobacter sp. FW306-1B-D06B TaxID=3140250 RepID=UPI0031405981